MVDLLSVATREIEGGRVYTLQGELDLSSCEDIAAQLIGPPGSLVIVDLSELTFMDSSGLGAIHTARRRVMEQGGHLFVSRPCSNVQKVLEITGFDLWLTDWDPAWSEPSALKLPNSAWNEAPWAEVRKGADQAHRCN
jgi:anti-anti-sigma factor